ncbi:MAG: multicopper oxidase domain-containing protein [Thermoleophilia bacterium]|nr:multicopper oxidase domain-containing protein [Thermoleophilia bacterium]
MTRRPYWKQAAATALALVAWLVVVGGAGAQAGPLNPAALTKFVDPLPIPPIARPAGPGYYELHMAERTVKMHRDLPATKVWGYNGGYLGPTIVADSGQPISVRWFNDLPAEHLFAASIDRSLDGMDALPDVRAVTHLHGGHVPDSSDGGPDAWFLPGENRLYYYPNDQEAATLWYHDHALGITRLNPYAGLAGGYVVSDAHERSLNLPSGAYDIPLIIQDKSFLTDGSQSYATQGILPAIHPTWVPEYFGTTVLVNGKVWPYLDVEPRKYRFRIVNGSNARFYGLSLTPAKDQDKLKPVLYQVGADGGLLPGVAPTQQLLVAPGERADVVVDFSKLAGTNVLLTNSAKTPYPAGASPDPRTVGRVMQFRVGTSLSGPDTSALPATPRPITKLSPAGKLVRDVPLTEILDPATGLPTKLQLEGRDFHDPVTITPRVGSTEVWRLINTTADTHPIHLHLVQFQVVDRQRFDVARVPGYRGPSAARRRRRGRTRTRPAVTRPRPAHRRAPARRRRSRRRRSPRRRGAPRACPSRGARAARAA